MLSKTKSLSIAALGPVQPAVRVACLLPHAFPFSREGFRPPASRKKTKRSDELAN